MTSAETARLFFALWPDRYLRDRIAALVTNDVPARGRRIPPEKVHLTLSFVGSVGPDTRECLEEAAEGLRVAPFTIQMDRLGYWVRPRILWLGTSRTPPELAELAAGLNQALGRCGLEPDKRPYVPHVTLLRNAGRMGGFVDVDPIPWTATEFALIRSKVGRGGSRYEVLRSWPLQCRI